MPYAIYRESGDEPQRKVEGGFESYELADAHCNHLIETDPDQTSVFEVRYEAKGIKIARRTKKKADLTTNKICFFTVN